MKIVETVGVGVDAELVGGGMARASIVGNKRGRTDESVRVDGRW